MAIVSAASANLGDGGDCLYSIFSRTSERGEADLSLTIVARGVLGDLRGDSTDAAQEECWSRKNGGQCGVRDHVIRTTKKQTRRVTSSCVSNCTQGECIDLIVNSGYEFVYTKKKTRRVTSCTQGKCIGLNSGSESVYTKGSARVALSGIVEPSERYLRVSGYARTHKRQLDRHRYVND
ncbi:hypothetical protein BDZ89DRAFT_370825 [Hymenopellis radicata]|nr:hypothetical protein BDZ89DRAFT_370825 [Hymenopellis radicata]